MRGQRRTVYRDRTCFDVTSQRGDQSYAAPPCRRPQDLLMHTYPYYIRLRLVSLLWCSGCAIRGTSYPYTEVDPEIFNMILNSVRSVTTESLSFLTYHKHGEFVLDVVSKFAATHHREWKGLSRLWSDMILLLREDTSTRIVDIMHSVAQI